MNPVFAVPGAPKALQDRIDATRARFAGFTMQATETSTTDAPPADTAGSDDDKNDKTDDAKPLGPPGERALARVKDENKTLRDELQQFKQQQADQAKALAAALGVKVDDKTTAPDALAALQQEMAELRTQNAVAALARANGITDEDDIATLAKIPDPDTRAAVAARFKPAADGIQKPGTPKPDRSIGRGAGTEKGGTASVAAARDEYLARRTPKK